MRYVCADIHGRMDRYEKALEIVKDDELIIIGDAVDRNRYGMDILIDTMKRDNVTLMCGNHEAMMCDYLFGGGLYGKAWLNPANGGLFTLEGYGKAIVDKKVTKKELREYLRNLPVTIDFGGAYLTHGMPVIKKGSYGMKNSPVITRMCDYNGETLHKLLWESCFSKDKNSEFEHIVKERNRQTLYLTGHVIADYGEGYMTETGLLTIPGKDNSMIFDLDGGCALPNDMESTLILFNLDTGESEFID